MRQRGDNIVLESVDDIESLINIIVNESIGSTLGYGRTASTSASAGVKSGAMRLGQGDQQASAIDAAMDDDKKKSNKDDANNKKRDTSDVHDEGSNDEHDDDSVSITIDSIITKLNTIRSGRSFKDGDVATEMEHYFNSLEDAERLALYAFLTGISEIVAGGEEGEEAQEPTHARVKMKTNVDVTSKQAKQPENHSSQRRDSSQSDEKRDEDEKKRKKSSEDDSPPIRVGSR